MPYLSFVFVCLVWGSSFILMKKGAVWFSPTAVGAWRLIGGAAILAIVWWRAGRKLSLQRRDLAALAFVVIFGFAWPFSIQPYLVGRDGSAFIGMTVSFTPLVTIAVSIPLLGAYPAARQLFGVLGALVFLALLMVDGIDRQIAFVDLALAMTVPVCYALSNTVIRRSLSHVASIELAFVSLSAAGTALLPLSFVVPFERPAVGSTEQFAAIASLLFLGVVGTGIATFVFNRMIQEQGPLFAGMVTNLVPIGALLWGWADHETVTTLQMGALVGLVAMVTVVQFGGARPGGE